MNSGGEIPKSRTKSYRRDKAKMEAKGHSAWFSFVM